MAHFLKETDFAPHQASEVLALAQSFKKGRGRHTPPSLKGQTWAMIFSKSSTRTRVSFDVGIHELGGHPIFLNKNDIQLGRGESVYDTANVLSRFVHGLIVRTFEQSELEELSKMGSIPVINALTDFLHPCQTYTDAFSMAERWSDGTNHLESLKGKKMAYFGDTANNIANSWILGAALFGMELVLAGPDGYEPGSEIKKILAESGYTPTYRFTNDPEAAARDADVLYTDTWVSMGQEEESTERIAVMSPYSVTSDLMKLGQPNALFMHDLPAYKGMEVKEDVLYGSKSIIFDQAENRLHTQKAIMAVLAQGVRA
ncbi:ornithine carbamoyltransferase [Candidatus Pelagisphaera phototrophica]|uniref:ornithine carbamoyltransferase n=1 Tax=Candidatus Pelagisphaera phototrophica TaxID=2684113 RepID=UPI001A0CF6AE|nr:ornithine carbamoyltransferase [Candidatus Pelagisphaera phototrophica]QXD32490.1 ornithine carbamoyltransferase [Candidatus Pelagisphaera phototrophica]